MDSDALYERWRQSRSRVERSERLADRVMEAISEPPALIEPLRESRHISGVVRAGVCAAAVVAALFRVAEILNLFVASRLE